jgi:CRP-like cAMP-binding protein
MLINQYELFQGTSMDFVKKFMDISQMSPHEKGEFLFREKDPARYFFILLNGCVKLSIGDTEHVVYRACRVGEAFGWSSLTGGDVYSASAQCLEPSKLLKTDSQKFARVLEKDTANGVVFFKHLAATLGNRLLESYKIISTNPKEERCR